MGQRLFIAVREGNTDAVRALLDEAANAQKALASSERSVKAITEKVKAVIIDPDGINDFDYDGCTALHVAAKQNYLGIIDLLLAYKAKPDKPELQKGATALAKAAKHGHEAATRKLLSAGANANLGNKFQETPLHQACFHGHGKIVTILLDSGADIHARSNLGQTPLIWAAGRGHLDITTLLLKRGARLDDADNNGDTALHRVGFNGHTQCAVHLVQQHRANRLVKNGKDRIPYQLAVSEKHMETAAVLKPDGWEEDSLFSKLKKLTSTTKPRAVTSDTHTITTATAAPVSPAKPAPPPPPPIKPKPTALNAVTSSATTPKSPSTASSASSTPTTGKLVVPAAFAQQQQSSAVHSPTAPPPPPRPVLVRQPSDPVLRDDALLGGVRKQVQALEGVKQQPRTAHKWQPM
eukprot:TRINITY_DN10808_c0_g1_i1.p1 TRINITY_DN10808_c0_g1~~TRINITY_DN10808_c0_g1_i1.p1  ORF type:complete len:408 (-),score=108.53 TRINITY_DN10808_c0_g1_i1:121-1344(-)